MPLIPADAFAHVVAINLISRYSPVPALALYEGTKGVEPLHEFGPKSASLQVTFKLLIETPPTDKFTVCSESPNLLKFHVTLYPLSAL